jgi:LPS O-antigen subunit length determinant protein (WzzB/FepE family)
MSETNEEVKVTKDEKTGDTIMKKPTRYARTEPTAQELAAEEALKAREETSPEENTEGVEPEGAEEQSFKKRYGDLRRHMQKTTEDKDKEIKKLQEQLSIATKKEIKLPKTDEEIENWAKEYPDVAKIVETIAMKKAAEQNKDIEERLNALSEKERLTSRERAEMELLQIHPDFVEIRDNPDFHAWAEEQPDYIQSALYENEDDPRAAARAIDLYKADMGVSKKKKTSKKDAAKAVTTKGSATTPDSALSDADTILESDVAKMSAIEYEQNEETIRKAIQSGKFVYDVSGAARA